MKAHLMHPRRDFDPREEPPPNHADLTQDLALGTLLGAMGVADGFRLNIARSALLQAPENDRETVLFRQEVLRDCLQHAAVVEELAAVAGAAVEDRRRQWLGFLGSHPSSILGGARGLLEMLTQKLSRLRELGERHGRDFESRGFRTFFAMVQAELPEDYLAEVRQHLRLLRFDRGILVSAHLGAANAGTGYMLCQGEGESPGWLRRALARQPKFTVHIAERDEAGSRALADLEDRGINLAANSVAQAADHVLNFFTALQAELAFYLGCVALHRNLEAKGVPLCFPQPVDPDARDLAFADMRDVALALTLDRPVVGNDLQTSGTSLLVVAGANQGGKSTFLRSLGLAQLMMQSGMFVAARAYRGSLCRRIFTHYKREEDKTMSSGKFDEELKRMSGLVALIVPGSLILFNESFAATNEREGSEVARQIVRALVEAGARVVFVTHLYRFAHDWWTEKRSDTVFLNAQREAEGRRTFKLLPGEPLSTSYGGDLYREIFKEEPAYAPSTQA